MQDKQGTTPLDACTEFEEEQMLWSDYRKPGLDDLDGLMFTVIPHGWAHNAVGGFMMHDPLRPWVAPGRKYMLRRKKYTVLERILRKLSLESCASYDNPACLAHLTGQMRLSDWRIARYACSFRIT